MGSTSPPVDPHAPNFHPVSSAFQPSEFCGELEPKDTEWTCPGGFAVETQIFYIFLEDGTSLMCQVIHSAVGCVLSPSKFPPYIDAPRSVPAPHLAPVLAVARAVYGTRRSSSHAGSTIPILRTRSGNRSTLQTSSPLRQDSTSVRVGATSIRSRTSRNPARIPQKYTPSLPTLATTSRFPSTFLALPMHPALKLARVPKADSRTMVKALPTRNHT